MKVKKRECMQADRRHQVWKCTEEPDHWELYVSATETRILPTNYNQNQWWQTVLSSFQITSLDVRCFDQEAPKCFQVLADLWEANLWDLWEHLHIVKATVFPVVTWDLALFIILYLLVLLFSICFLTTLEVPGRSRTMSKFAVPFITGA